MWKVRDDVNLKDLEKFGYKLNDWGLLGTGYLKELEYTDFVFIDENRNIIFEFEDPMDITACENEAIEDLIKADLVEKI